MRVATATRLTNETSIKGSIALDEPGTIDINTGVPFLDHLLTNLAKHARISLSLRCQGDLMVDDHHTVEDCALVLGTMLADALGDKRGIKRFGTAFAPLDEALVRAVVDLSGRSFAFVSLQLNTPPLGTMATQNVPHFFRSLASAARMTLHIDEMRGENDHHRAEAACKALALALRDAITKVDVNDVPSTKGML